MKCTLVKSEIQDVLAKVQGLTGRKTNLAITANVRITAQDDDTVRIEATDLETDFSGIYPATVDVPGTIVINARKLFEIIRNFPAEEIDLNEVENRWIEIGGGKVLYHIVGMNPDDFPEVVTETEESAFLAADAFQVRKMIEKTIGIPAPSDEKRVHIIGVLFEAMTDGDGACLRMVSTDAKRMAKYDVRPDMEIGENVRVLIPKKALSEVHKFLDSDGTVKLGVTNNRFIVVKEMESFSVNLLEGDFPPYEELVRCDEEVVIPVERMAFLMMLKRMAILSSEAYKSVIFSLEKDLLTVTASNPDLGESREEMGIPFEREGFEVAFNPRFFIEALSAVEDETAHIYLRNNSSPCLVRAASEGRFLSVIMPMKI